MGYCYYCGRHEPDIIMAEGNNVCVECKPIRKQDYAIRQLGIEYDQYHPVFDAVDGVDSDV